MWRSEADISPLLILFDLKDESEQRFRLITCRVIEGAENYGELLESVLIRTEVGKMSTTIMCRYLLLIIIAVSTAILPFERLDLSMCNRSTLRVIAKREVADTERRSQLPAWQCGYYLSEPLAAFRCAVACPCNGPQETRAGREATSGGGGSSTTIITQADAEGKVGGVETLVGDLLVVAGDGEEIVFRTLRRGTGQLRVSGGRVRFEVLSGVGDLVNGGTAVSIELPRLSGICDGELVVTSSELANLRLPSYQSGCLNRV